MQIVEVEIKLPYREKGAILSRILSRVRGRIKDIHFLPPDATGMSEIRMEVLENNPHSLLGELKRMIKKGKITFRVLSEA
ncbi:hypothetical protein [Thermococcus sp.]